MSDTAGTLLQVHIAFVSHGVFSIAVLCQTHGPFFVQLVSRHKTAIQNNVKSFSKIRELSRDAVLAKC